MAQMDSAFPSEGKGRKFESCREHHFGPVGESLVPVALSRLETVGVESDQENRQLDAVV